VGQFVGAERIIWMYRKRNRGFRAECHHLSYHRPSHERTARALANLILIDSGISPFVWTFDEPEIRLKYSKGFTMAMFHGNLDRITGLHQEMARRGSKEL
jgi:hypothetical protein